jgi:hypothetical protein
MSNTPIHQFLWDITLPTVRATWAAGRKYVETGKYVRRLEPPAYKESDSGWPMTVDADRFQVPVSAPVDWTSLFALEPTEYTYVTVDDVPELSSALEAVSEAARHDESFASGLNAFNFTEDVQRRERHLRVDYLTLISSIIGRAAATNANSDEEIVQIYLQLERARFEPTLKGDLVAPVTLTDFGTDQRITLSDDVHIERIAPELQCSRAPSLQSAEGVNSYLVAAATHSIVVRGVVIPNEPYSRRVLGVPAGPPLIGADDVAKIDTAIQCIHIITGEKTGYNQLLVRPDGWADRWVCDLPPVWKIETVARYPESPYRAPWQGPRVPIKPEDVQQISAAFPALSASPNDVKLAARRAVRAMMRTNDEDRTLDATIGVEALLLDDSAELKYRMALRAAAALFDEYRPEAIPRSVTASVPFSARLSYAN